MTVLNIVADRNMRGLEQSFGPFGRVRLVDGRRLQRGDLADADVLLVRSVTAVGPSLLDGSTVRFVGSATSGIDHVDRQYLAERGIVFAHAPGANAGSVVEYVLTAIAAVGGRLEQLLDGGSVGIVGCGNTGRLLARTLGALGIAHRVYDPWLDPDTIPHCAPLEQVLDCEVVSLHAELTRRQPWPSYHLLHAGNLGALRCGALLVNACRGAVVDNRALLTVLAEAPDALQVVLDVWEREPAISANLLRQVDLGTAHIAGYSLDGKLLATRMLARALADAFDLEAPEVPAESAPPPVAVPAGLGGAALLRWLLLQRFDIRSFDRELREATLDRQPEEAARAFDGLRRTHPDRRELRGTTLQLAGQGERDVALLRALGCVLPEP